MRTKIGNRALQTTTTTGTGTLSLGSAVAGHQTFIASAGIATGDKVAYCIVDDLSAPTIYEIGRGAITSGAPDTLSRDTIIESSNSNNAVSLAAGTKYVFAIIEQSQFDAAALGGTLRAVTGADTAVAGDDGKLLVCTGTSYTLGFTAAATLGAGWRCMIRADVTGLLTLDPNASETVDGATTVVLTPGQTCIVECDGSNFKTISRPSTGSAVLLSTATPAGAASVEFTSLMNAALYTHYELVFDFLNPATDNVNILLTVSINNGSSYLSSGYQYAINFASTSAVAAGGSDAGSSFALANGVGNNTNEGIRGFVKMICGAAQFAFSADLAAFVADGTVRSYATRGGIVAAAVNAIKIAASSGNLTATAIHLIGYRK